MPQYVEDRLAAANIDHYFDAAAGLHAHCDDGRLWEILSGEPSTRSSADPSVEATGTEWLSVTDLGVNLDPEKKPAGVLALLRTAGLLERVDKKDVPSPSAIGLYEERVIDSGYADGNTVQRRWAYEVLAILRQQLQSD